MTDSPQPLRVLFVEDEPDDVALLVRSLRKAGYEPKYAQVDTEAAMRDELAKQTWDVVLTDYTMPQFNAHQALKLLKDLAPYTPMIVVSGNVGEETAVSVVKAGAGDYVMKDSLTRLAPAIEREMREAQTRREHDESMADRRRQEELIRDAFFAAPVALLLVAANGGVLAANAAARSLLTSDPTGKPISNYMVWPSSGEPGPASTKVRVSSVNPDGTVAVSLVE